MPDTRTSFTNVPLVEPPSSTPSLPSTPRKVACVRDTSGSGSTWSQPSRPTVMPGATRHSRPAIGCSSTNTNSIIDLLGLRGGTPAATWTIRA